MLRSLVGSEMCIRDRLKAAGTRLAQSPVAPSAPSSRRSPAQTPDIPFFRPVSPIGNQYHFVECHPGCHCCLCRRRLSSHQCCGSQSGRSSRDGHRTRHQALSGKLSTFFAVVVYRGQSNCRREHTLICVLMPPRLLNVLSCATIRGTHKTGVWGCGIYRSSCPGEETLDSVGRSQHKVITA